MLLPLTFLSSALMQQDLAPGWIGTVAKFNPVNWAVEAGRSAAMEQIDWGLVAGRLGLLFALVVLAAVFATRAFGTYQRSLYRRGPCSWASTTAWTRSRRPSFCSRWRTCVFDRRERDHQLLGDLAVGEAAADEPRTSSSRGRQLPRKPGLRERPTAGARRSG